MGLSKEITKVFNIPDELVTEVQAGEKMFVCSVGGGKAKICGKKACIEVDGSQVKLGESFYATATNKLVREPQLNDMVAPPPKLTQLLYKGKSVR